MLRLTVSVVVVGVVMLSHQTRAGALGSTHGFGGGEGFSGWENSYGAGGGHYEPMGHFGAGMTFGHGDFGGHSDFGGHEGFSGADAGYGNAFGSFEVVHVEDGGHSQEHDTSAHEDQAALNAVGLANLLTGGGLGGAHAHLASSQGSSYTISGPTHEIKSLHKIQLTNGGGHVLSKSPGHGGDHKTIVFVKEPMMIQHGGHGWY